MSFLWFLGYLIATPLLVSLNMNISLSWRSLEDSSYRYFTVHRILFKMVTLVIRQNIWSNWFYRNMAIDWTKFNETFSSPLSAASKPVSSFGDVSSLKKKRLNTRTVLRFLNILLQNTTYIQITALFSKGTKNPNAPQVVQYWAFSLCGSARERFMYGAPCRGARSKQVLMHFCRIWG